MARCRRARRRLPPPRNRNAGVCGETGGVGSVEKRTLRATRASLPRSNTRPERSDRGCVRSTRFEALLKTSEARHENEGSVSSTCSYVTMKKETRASAPSREPLADGEHRRVLFVLFVLFVRARLLRANARGPGNGPRVRVVRVRGARFRNARRSGTALLAGPEKTEAKATRPSEALRKRPPPRGCAWPPPSHAAHARAPPPPRARAPPQPPPSPARAPDAPPRWRRANPPLFLLRARRSPPRRRLPPPQPSGRASCSPRRASCPVRRRRGGARRARLRLRRLRGRLGAARAASAARTAEARRDVSPRSSSSAAAARSATRSAIAFSTDARSCSSTAASRCAAQSLAA